MGQLACMLAYSIIYSAPELLRNVCHVCVHVLHIPDMMSLGFTCDVNHINMMSLEFAFNSHHVGMMWHDVIGVHAM